MTGLNELLKGLQHNAALEFLYLRKFLVWVISDLNAIGKRGADDLIRFIKDKPLHPIIDLGKSNQ